MKGDQAYNDTASGYFILLLLVVLTLPATFIFLKNRLFKSRGDAQECPCGVCESKRAPKKGASRGPSGATILKAIVLILLWVALFFVVSSLQSEAPSTTYFDPYTILGLSPGASTEEIKKAYRQLSLKHHPDKAQDPTDPDVQARYISIVKAYDTLTDELVRANWEKYGNPDGPQAMSVGIALPSWLVKNGGAVLAVYMAVLVVGIPAVVCVWWQGWKKFDTSSKVRNNTMGLYYHAIESNCRMKVLVEIMGASEEFKDIPQRGSDEKLKVKNVPEKYQIKKKPRFNAPYAIKSHQLLLAQIFRSQADLGSAHKTDLHMVLERVRTLLGGMVAICSAKGFVLPLLDTLEMLQCITQSCAVETPFMQLPHYNDHLSIVANKRCHAHTLSALARLTKEGRRDIFTDKALMYTDQQIEDIEAVLRHMPTNVRFDFWCDVEGDAVESSGGNNATTTTQIVCKSIVTLFLELSRDGPAATKDIEELKEKEKLTDKDKDQDDDAFVPAKRVKEAPKIAVHAPFFPDTREECWWVIMASETGMLVGIQKVGPIGQHTENKIKFQAPEAPGNYTFQVHLICDGYHGFDQKRELKVKVVREDPAVIAAQQARLAKERQLLEEEDADLDFSDEEDDDEEEKDDARITAKKTK